MKNKSRSFFIFFIYTISLSENSTAAECSSYVNINYSCSINGAAVSGDHDVGWSSFISTYGTNGKILVNNDLKLNLKSNANYADYISTGLSARDSSLINVGSLNLSISSSPQATNISTAMTGVSAWGGASINIDTADITLTPRFSAGGSSKESYGIQVGTGNTGDEGSDGKTSIVQVRNAKIFMRNSNDSVSGQMMAGIRVIDPDSYPNSVVTFISTGNLTIDMSSSNTGIFLSGIYVSGTNDKAILNNSNITIGKSDSNSAAIILGKARSTGSGGAEIHSQGNLTITTTADSNAVGIRLKGDNSKLIANYQNSSANITTSGTAILFGSTDISPLALHTGTYQEVKLKNAAIRSTSDTADLVVVDSRVKEALLEVSGEKSYLQSSKNGYLINVTSGRTLTFNLLDKALAEGMLNKASSSGTTLNVNIENSAEWRLKPYGTTLSTTLDEINLTNGGILNAGTNLVDPSGYTLIATNIYNSSGIIKINNNQILNRNNFTINGNYIGGSGSVLQVNSLWNTKNGTSITNSDLLTLNGNVSGTTKVKITARTIGDVHADDNPTYSADVIHINGSETGQVFHGTADTSNAGIVKLVKNSPTSYAWIYAGSFDPDPTDPNNPEEPIYSDSVPGYVTGAYVNMELIRDSMTHYRERKGGEYYKGYAQETSFKEKFWGRTWGRQMKGKGDKRFDWKSNNYGLQIGYEFDHQKDGATTIVNDAYLAYGHADSKKYDDYRFDSLTNGVNINKSTGSMRTHNFSAAISRTYLDPEGSYKDALLQISTLKNRYYGNQGIAASNRGWALSASWEQGASYQVKDKWYIDPMYQLVVNYLSLKNFNDGARNISQGSHWDGLLRTGGRLYHREPINPTQSNLMYLQAYYAHDFSHNGKAQIGRDFIREKNARQWLELAIGFQKYRDKNTYFFLDAGIDRNLGGAYRHSYKVNAGVNHNW